MKRTHLLSGLLLWWLVVQNPIHVLMCHGMAGSALGRVKLGSPASSTPSREMICSRFGRGMRTPDSAYPEALIARRHDFPPWAKNLKEINPEDAARWGSDKTIVADWEIDPNWPKVDKW